MLASRKAITMAACCAIPLFIGVLAGCSQEPSSESTPKSQAQIEKAAKEWDRANAKCLREEGVEVGDPGAGKGGMALDAGGDMEAISQAMKTCRARIVDELGERPVSASEKKQQSEAIEKSREIAECVRGKGYDMPDVEAGGGGTLMSKASDVPQEVIEACGGGAPSGKK